MKKLLFVSIISVAVLLSANYAYGLTASEFVAKYDNEFSEGKWVTVFVKVSGKPQSDDPTIRAKEVRYLQTAVLKFIHFAGARNVVSDTQENQFTATMTTSLADKISKRSDVVSITILDNDTKETKSCYSITKGANLSGCNLYGINLQNADLRNVDFTNANLKATNLSGANLSGANLQRAFLRDSNLNGANLSNANLSFAKLINAEIKNADLTNVNFYKAFLYRSDLTASDLTDADLRHATLTHTNLSYTNLSGANLGEAGIWGTNFNNCKNHKICE